MRHKNVDREILRRLDGSTVPGRRLRGIDIEQFLADGTLERIVERVVDLAFRHEMPAHRPSTRTIYYRRAFAGALQSVNAQAGTLDAILSREVVALDGMIVRLAGLDLAGWQRTGAQILVGHDVSSPSNIIGRATKVWIDGDTLRATIEFAVEESELAASIFRLYAAGFARAFSIQWVPVSVVYPTSPQAQIDTLTPTERQALLSGAARAIVTRSTLVEVSAVGAPADSHAVAI